MNITLLDTIQLCRLNRKTSGVNVEHKIQRNHGGLAENRLNSLSTRDLSVADY